MPVVRKGKKKKAKGKAKTTEKGKKGSKKGGKEDKVDDRGLLEETEELTYTERALLDIRIKSLEEKLEK